MGTMATDPGGTPARRPVVIDCDPGLDDAVAMALAVLDPRLEVLAVTTVAGNSFLVNTTRNALLILERLGSPVPVHAGAASPLVGRLTTAHDVHGTSGLAGAEALGEPTGAAVEPHAVDALAAAVRTTPGLTLVALGPLTNLAIFARRYPELVEDVGEVVFMGGGIAFGNVTPVAEFNLYCDPEAAAVVLETFPRIVMVPLDVTHQATADAAILERIGAVRHPVAAAFARMLAAGRSADRRLYGVDAAILHDPCAVAWLLAPELFTADELPVAVELAGRLTRGQTVVDVWRADHAAKGVTVARSIDRAGFFALLLERLAQLDRR